jgi:hypothetical protein
MASIKIILGELKAIIREVVSEELTVFREEIFRMQANKEDIRGAERGGADQLVTTAEVCRRWGRSRSTLCRLVRERRLVPTGKFRQSFTFKVADIASLFGPPVL